ncbi:hypothetical protein Tco_1271699 [Tanacetum coccineum]
MSSMKFDSSSYQALGACFAVADDTGKKTNEEPANKGKRNGQEKEGGALNKEGDQNVQDFRAKLDNLLVQQNQGYDNSTNRVSTFSPSVSAVGESFTNADDLPTDPLMPDLEDTVDLLNTGIFSGAYDDEDEGAEADLNNLEKTMNMDVKSEFLYGTIEKEVQDKYVADILKKFDFSSVKTASTLIETNKELLKDEEAEDVDVHLYRLMIRSLISARYLKDQPKLGLWYPRDSPFDLEAFSDSDYAGASLDRKSTIRVLECLTPEALIEGRLISVKMLWIMLDMRWNNN